MYQIKDLQEKKAKAIGVIIKSSTRKGKKIDVFDKNNTKLASIGGSGYKDYATYINEKGLEFAKMKRRAYLARHHKDPKYKNGKLTPGYFAKKILW
jgi:hypothetical protein